MIKHVSPGQVAGGTTRRASADHDDTAQPPLTSGFGTVMEMEQDLRGTTRAELGRDNGPKSAAIDRILDQHLHLLDANLALLAQRYEMLPTPGRFAALPAADGRLMDIAAVLAAQDSTGWMTSLVAQHVDLGVAIGALIARRPDGQRGELILAEIGRNHEEMAWMLTALLREEPGCDSVDVPAASSRLPPPASPEAETAWENEGGH